MMKIINRSLIFILLFLAGNQELVAFRPVSDYLPHKACNYHIERIERTQGIPQRLLAAIAKVESGRPLPGTKAKVAWPWTINAEGKGQFFPTKEAAIKEVRRLQAKGVKSIDVGCMQVNLNYHGEAFNNLEEAFDPRANVEYAAQFLKDLKDAHTSWNKAVAHYHSATPEFHNPYRQRVYNAWIKERQQIGEPYFQNAVWGSPGIEPWSNRVRTFSYRNPLHNRYGRPNVYKGVKVVRSQSSRLFKDTGPVPSKIMDVPARNSLKLQPHLVRFKSPKNYRNQFKPRVFRLAQLGASSKGSRLMR